MNCGSGYYAEGDYSITNDQIYLLNYKCPACLTCNNEYNCSPIIILTYKITDNNEIEIYSGNQIIEKIK